MTRGKNTKRRPWPPKKADLEALIEEAIVDAYGESAQRTGFYTMIDEHLGVPFEAELLGVAATVERIDMTDDEQIVAICRRGRSRQAIPILDLPLPDPLPAGAEWIAAYRHWARAVYAAMAQKRIPEHLQAWIDARKHHKLSHAHAQMARQEARQTRQPAVLKSSDQL